MLPEANKSIRSKVLRKIPVKANYLREDMSKIEGSKTPTLYESDEKSVSTIAAHMNENAEIKYS